MSQLNIRFRKVQKTEWRWSSLLPYRTIKDYWIIERQDEEYYTWYEVARYDANYHWFGQIQELAEQFKGTLL